ncbi:MAG: putative soluble lytic transglycosylase fused to an ABC-type amino acid-binding protein [Rhodobacteraceae bacterium HLUCCA08]|nr:MAG: putative soluble lytic transglycosylase fused to an ABC-type amino acid-binding protein [Rhodobacteraceae bacterium HLUCCA08]
MFARRLILGGIAALTLAAAASADGPQTDTRPLSRADAAAAQAQADHARLAALRPAARPVWMIRHPVAVNRPGPDTPRPMMRSVYMPDARWDHIRGSEAWTRAAMTALRNHGTRLEQTVPRDIATWCPAYTDNPPELRRAFWVGMMSALAKHESTWRPEAVGGGGLWYGLLQIYPDTARRYGCRARTGDALTDPGDNLSCAVRIMNVTVPRDNAIALRDTRWRGVAADWGPMTNRTKIAEMAAWTRAQEYCRPQLAVMVSLRPESRPEARVVSTMDAPG